MSQDRKRKYGNLMKKGAAVIAAVVIIALLAGFTAWMWKVQKRDKEDLSVQTLQTQKLDAIIAKAMLPLIDQVESLRAALRVLSAGSPTFNADNQQLTDLQNLISTQMPALVAGKDGKGNAIIIPVDQARSLLTQMASFSP